jgi:hypothetical protein
VNAGALVKIAALILWMTGSGCEADSAACTGTLDSEVPSCVCDGEYRRRSGRRPVLMMRLPDVLRPADFSKHRCAQMLPQNTFARIYDGTPSTVRIVTFARCTFTIRRSVNLMACQQVH